jgi:mannosyltransferase OCH1-like enzyme
MWLKLLRSYDALDGYSRLANGIPRTVWSCAPSQIATSELHRHVLSLRQRNREWSFKIVTDRWARGMLQNVFRAVPGLADVLEAAKFGPMRADLIRYALLEQYGGVYIDVTKCPTQRLDNVFSSRGSIALTYERNPIGDQTDVFGNKILADRMVANWMLGSTPGNHFFLELLRDIVNQVHAYRGVVFDNPKCAILSLTGPVALTNFVARRYPDAGLVQLTDFGETVFPRVNGSCVPLKPRRHYAYYRNKKIFKD